MKNCKKYKIISLLLQLILLFGLLTHSLTYFILNITIPFSSISTSSHPERLFNIRFSLRQAVDSIQGFCQYIYLFGNLILLFFSRIKYRRDYLYHLSCKKIFEAFVAAIFFTLLCVVPFAILEKNKIFVGDYFFPVWTALAFQVIIFVFKYVICLRYAKMRKEENI